MAPEKGHTAYPPKPGPTETTAYPKRLYHKDKGEATVNDEKEHKALGAGWQEKPFPKPAAAKRPGSDDDGGDAA